MRDDAGSFPVPFPLLEATMPKRLYLSDVIGTGTRADPYRPAISTIANVTKTNVINAPARMHCVVLVDAPGPVHADLAADARVDLIPAIGLNDRWDTLTLAQRTAIRNRLIDRGFDVSSIGNVVLFRVILRHICRQIRNEFDEDRFDVTG